MILYYGEQKYVCKDINLIAESDKFKSEKFEKALSNGTIVKLLNALHDNESNVNANKDVQNKNFISTLTKEEITAFSKLLDDMDKNIELLKLLVQNKTELTNVLNTLTNNNLSVNTTLEKDNTTISLNDENLKSETLNNETINEPGHEDILQGTVSSSTN